MSLPEQFGSFSNNVMTEWTGDDHRSMRLLRDFSFEDRSGKTWRVPAGTEIDGASIPRLLWWVVGSPFVGRYRNASVVHDHYCELQNEPWEDVHRLFYHACLAGGVNKYKALIMYWAVYMFGPSWSDDGRQGAEQSMALYRPLLPRHAGIS